MRRPKRGSHGEVSLLVDVVDGGKPILYEQVIKLPLRHLLIISHGIPWLVQWHLEAIMPLVFVHYWDHMLLLWGDLEHNVQRKVPMVKLFSSCVPRSPRADDQDSNRKSPRSRPCCTRVVYQLLEVILLLLYVRHLACLRAPTCELWPPLSKLFELLCFLKTLL